jgi:DmsE family decaheme c-type cytochrome
MAAEDKPVTESQPTAQAAQSIPSPSQSSIATQVEPVSQAQANSQELPVVKTQLPEMGAEDVKPAQVALKRDAICTRCHNTSEAKPVLSIYQTKHGVKGDSLTPTCQGCHGESEIHTRDHIKGVRRASADIVFKKGKYAISDRSERSEICLTCHKGTDRSNWEGSQHQKNQMACDNCHVIHSPIDKVRGRKLQAEVCFTCHKDQRADMHKISSHPIDAGKIVCSDCHNLHGSVGPKLLNQDTVNETCYTCHAEKRGPFLWEHQPVIENCINCHTPHGSNISPLLKSRPPSLCQGCHDGPHVSATPIGPQAGGYQSGWSGTTAAGNTQYPSAISGGGRGCMNCHAMIHGSNSPAGAFLHR